jgi:alpha-pyrone synthase
MPYLLDIYTAVPKHEVSQKEMVRFYLDRLQNPEKFSRKINFIAEKTKIEKRYSCIGDFTENNRQLFKGGTTETPGIEQRMEIYNAHIVPLAKEAATGVLNALNLQPNEITHLITVSCTGLQAPGFEYELAGQLGLAHAEKSAINFLGCHAAIKALKQASYIAKANPEACVLIVCAELCSLHFVPSETDEDIIANLLFGDGAAAAIVCGTANRHAKNHPALSIDTLGFASIPATPDLMTWKLSPVAFRMFLSTEIVDQLRNNLHDVITDFLGLQEDHVDYWAIHPGGVGILQAVRSSLSLGLSDLKYAANVLQKYGNMSSPTILFVLKEIINDLNKKKPGRSRSVFSCAFGPGLGIEMILMNTVVPDKAGNEHNPASYVIHEAI